MKKMAQARRKGIKTEIVGKQFTSIEFRRKDRKYKVFHLQSQKGFEKRDKTKGGYESSGIVDSIAVRKMAGDLNTLEIILIERKARRTSKIPTKKQDQDINKALIRACKKCIIKYATFRHRIGKKRQLTISLRIK